MARSKKPLIDMANAKKLNLPSGGCSNFPYPELAGQIKPIVRSVCARYRLPRSLQSDLEQEVWIALLEFHRRNCTFDLAVFHPERYAYRVAHHKAIDHIRFLRKSRIFVNLEDLEECDHLLSTSRDIPSLASLMLIVDQVETLDDSSKTVLRMRFGTALGANEFGVGLTTKQIARKLRKPRGTVASTLFRSIARIRRGLGNESEGGPLF